MPIRQIAAFLTGCREVLSCRPMEDACSIFIAPACWLSANSVHATSLDKHIHAYLCRPNKVSSTRPRVCTDTPAAACLRSTMAAPASPPQAFEAPGASFSDCTSLSFQSYLEKVRVCPARSSALEVLQDSTPQFPLLRQHASHPACGVGPPNAGAAREVDPAVEATRSQP